MHLQAFMQRTVILWLLAPRGVPGFFGIGGEMVFVWVDSHASILRPFLRPQRVPALSCVEPAECRHRKPALGGRLHNLEHLLYQTASGNEFLVGHLQSMVCCKEVELIISGSGQTLADNYDI
jgi:hypothetical protein